MVPHRWVGRDQWCLTGGWVGASGVPHRGWVGASGPSQGVGASGASQWVGRGQWCLTVGWVAGDQWCLTGGG